MKLLIVFGLCLSLLAGCSSERHDDSDQEFIERALAKIPNGDFYNRWEWKLESGSMDEFETRLTMSYDRGDTSIYATLQAHVEREDPKFFRRLQILVLNGDRKERMVVYQEADTVFRFSVPRDFLFNYEQVRDTGTFVFISGKHRFMYENQYYDSCQTKLYLSKEDSLSKVRGNVQQLSKCP